MEFPDIEKKINAAVESKINKNPPNNFLFLLKLKPFIEKFLSSNPKRLNTLRNKNASSCFNLTTTFLER